MNFPHPAVAERASHKRDLTLWLSGSHAAVDPLFGLALAFLPY